MSRYVTSVKYNDRRRPVREQTINPRRKAMDQRYRSFRFRTSPVFPADLQLNPKIFTLKKVLNDCGETSTRGVGRNRRRKDRQESQARPAPRRERSHGDFCRGACEARVPPENWWRGERGARRASAGISRGERRGLLRVGVLGTVHVVENPEIVGLGHQERPRRLGNSN